MDQNTQPSVLAELDAVHEAVLHHDPRILASDLRHVHGVLTTNGALLHLPPGYGRGMAVYPHQALLNHSCLCNTTSQDFPQDRKVEIQARYQIKAGEEITTSYIRPTQVWVCKHPASEVRHFNSTWVNLSNLSKDLRTTFIIIVHIISTSINFNSILLTTFCALLHYNYNGSDQNSLLN